jgi:hypothetical protein
MSNKNDKALDILQRYYNRLMNQLAEEIIEKDQEFDQGYLAMAEDLIFTYSNKLSCLSVIMSNLGHVSQHESSTEAAGAGVAEIRCTRDQIAPRIQDWLDMNPRANIVGFDVLPAAHNGNGTLNNDSDNDNDASDNAPPPESEEVTCVLIYGREEDSAS